MADTEIPREVPRRFNNMLSIILKKGQNSLYSSSEQLMHNIKCVKSAAMF